MDWMLVCCRKFTSKFMSLGLATAAFATSTQTGEEPHPAGAASVDFAIRVYSRSSLTSNLIISTIRQGRCSISIRHRQHQHASQRPSTQHHQPLVIAHDQNQHSQPNDSNSRHVVLADRIHSRVTINTIVSPQISRADRKVDIPEMITRSRRIVQ